MSWIEDALFDSRDFDEYPSIDENWEEGFHIDQNGKKWKLKKMTDNHLENLIKYFEGKLSVEALLKEQKRRQKHGKRKI